MAVYDSSVGAGSRFDEEAGYADESLYQNYGRKHEESPYANNGHKQFEDANFKKEKPTWMGRTGSAFKSTSSGVKKSVPVVKAGLGHAATFASYSGSKMKTGYTWTKEKLTTKK